MGARCRWFAVGCAWVCAAAPAGARPAADPTANPTTPNPTTPNPTAPDPTTPNPTAPDPTAPGDLAEPGPAILPVPDGGFDDGDGPVRLSLATEDDAAAWRTGGFRVELGLNYGHFAGLEGAPSGSLLGVVVRLGARLDAHWSLLTSLQYASASGDGGLAGLRITDNPSSASLFGLRYAGTLDPTWHVNDHFDLSVGFGFGGVVEGNTPRLDPDAGQRAALNNSYTLPDADPPLQSCRGVGAVGLVRGAWHLLLGPRARTGLSLEFMGQFTGCIDDTRRLELDTARPIVRRQWWPHLGTTLAWTVTWR